jgi:anti-sigma B factor antagonist
MEFRVKEYKKKINISLVGDILLGEIGNLRHDVVELATNNDKDIIIDFSKVDYIDSTGIGLLLRLSGIQKSKNRSFNIINLSDRIKKILELSSLGDFL